MYNHGAFDLFIVLRTFVPNVTIMALINALSDPFHYFFALNGFRNLSKAQECFVTFPYTEIKVKKLTHCGVCVLDI